MIVIQNCCGPGGSGFAGCKSGKKSNFYQRRTDTLREIFKTGKSLHCCEKPFSLVVTYRNIANHYAYTFQAMKDLSFDLWLSSHAGQCMLHGKHYPGDAYNPAAFFDRIGYKDN